MGQVWHLGQHSKLLVHDWTVPYTFLEHVLQHSLISPFSTNDNVPDNKDPNYDRPWKIRHISTQWWCIFKILCPFQTSGCEQNNSTFQQKNNFVTYCQEIRTFWMRDLQIMRHFWLYISYGHLCTEGQDRTCATTNSNTRSCNIRGTNYHKTNIHNEVLFDLKLEMASKQWSVEINMIYNYWQICMIYQQMTSSVTSTEML
jgi:hypothetical protein